MAQQSALTAGIFYIAAGMILLLLGFAGRILIPGLDDPEHVIPALAMRYLSPVLLAAVALAVALYVKQIYDLMVNSWAFLFVGILVPVTAALYWKKANRAAAWASMVSGVLTWGGYIFIKSGSLKEISDPLFYQAPVRPVFATSSHVGYYEVKRFGMKKLRRILQSFMQLRNPSKFRFLRSNLRSTYFETKSRAI